MIFYRQFIIGYIYEIISGYCAIPENHKDAFFPETLNLKVTQFKICTFICYHFFVKLHEQRDANLILNSNKEKPDIR